MLRIALALPFFVAFNLVAVPGGEKAKFTLTADEKRVFELTNQERKDKEAPPLKLNPLLCKIARAHSENMAKQMKMEHTLDDKSPFDRMKDAGYDFATAGENIGTSSEDAGIAFMMKTWMESEGHRENILNPKYTEFGVGIARDKDGVVYYTQVFGKPLE